MRFPATRRSVLERVGSADDRIRREAFGDLAGGYWKPAYHYLRLQWRMPADEAEEAVQAFFATAFEKHYLERFDPVQARFRTFLRVCLDRFVQNLRKAASADKRGGGVAVLSLDFPGAERELDDMATAIADRDRFFHDETVRFLFTRAVASLQAACAEAGRDVVFHVFERHDLAPGPDTSYASVAGALGLSVSQVTNHLHVARRQFRDLALGHLRALSATDDEYRREAREMFGVEIEP
jgi:DNA-directed RNA polymerase specialized sigma24 family protein